MAEGLETFKFNGRYGYRFREADNDVWHKDPAVHANSTLAREDAAKDIRWAMGILGIEEAGEEPEPEPEPEPTPKLILATAVVNGNVQVSPTWNVPAVYIERDGTDINGLAPNWGTSVLPEDRTISPPFSNLKPDVALTVSLHLPGGDIVRSTIQTASLPVVDPPPNTGSRVSKLGFTAQGIPDNEWHGGQFQNFCEQVSNTERAGWTMWRAIEEGHYSGYTFLVDEIVRKTAAGGILEGKRPLVRVPIGFSSRSVAQTARGESDQDLHAFYRHVRDSGIMQRRPVFTLGRENTITGVWGVLRPGGEQEHKTACERILDIAAQYVPELPFFWPIFATNWDCSRALPVRPNMKGIEIDPYNGNGGVPKVGGGMYDTWTDPVKAFENMWTGWSSYASPMVGSWQWIWNLAVSRNLQIGFGEFGVEANEAVQDRSNSGGDDAFFIREIAKRCDDPRVLYACIFPDYATGPSGAFKDHNIFEHHDSGQFDDSFAAFVQEFSR